MLRSGLNQVIVTYSLYLVPCDCINPEVQGRRKRQTVSSHIRGARMDRAHRCSILGELHTFFCESLQSLQEAHICNANCHSCPHLLTIRVTSLGILGGGVRQKTLWGMETSGGEWVQQEPWRPTLLRQLISLREQRLFKWEAVRGLWGECASLARAKVLRLPHKHREK